MILGRLRAATSTAIKAANSFSATTTEGSLGDHNIIDKFSWGLVSVRNYLETVVLGFKVVNRNAKLKVKQTEDSKLCQRLDSETSSTKTWCDQLTETMQQHAREKEQAEEDKKFFEEMLRKNFKALDEFNCFISGKQGMLLMQPEKGKRNQSYQEELYSNDTMIKEKDSVIRQLEGSIAMVHHMEVPVEAETSSGINRVGKLPHEDCKKELLQKFLKLESDNQELLHQVQSVYNNAEYLQGECQLSEAKKQYDLMLEGKKIKLSNHLKKPFLKNYQVINEIHKKYEIEKIEFTNAEKEKAQNLKREMENKCNEKISEKKVSKRYFMHLKDEHGAMVARIQQDKEHNESTLQAYLKEELQLIQSQAENELRERLSLLRKETELEIKSLRMKHEEECQRMQDELEFKNTKEEKQRVSLQLQKAMGEKQLGHQEVNSNKKVAVKALYFSFHQFRMVSSYSRNPIDERAPGNTATIILDYYNLPASKRSYTRAIKKVVEWCKAKSKVIDLSEYFGSGAEIFTTPEKGIFHLKVRCRDREITLFINARDLYLLGWNGDRHGAFEIKSSSGENEESYIKVPGCSIINSGFNYYDISKHSLEDVGIGLASMVHAFESIYKCDGVRFSDALDGLARFAVNISEAVRNEEVCNEIEYSFDHCYLDRLDLRWDENSGRDRLSTQIRSYSSDSRQYLKYIDCMIRKQPLPKLISRGDRKGISIDDLRNRIKVPLRDSYNEGKFFHEDRPGSDVWCPPYPNGKGWISEEEEDEE